MFTDTDKRRKNWRTKLRKLKKARNKVKRLTKQLNEHRHTDAELPKLKEQITDAKVLVSTLELQVGDRPE